MKKKNIHILWMALTVGVSGCNDLDEVVYSGVTEQTYSYSVNDFIPNIAGAYEPLHGDFVGGYWQTQELTGCCVVTPPNSTGWDDGGIYKRLHFHNWNSELGQISSLWNNYFKGVILCNGAIERLEKDIIPSPSPEKKQQGISELRTLRAYYYWILMDNFGDIPLVTTMSQDLPGKTARAQVYDFIVKELGEAIPDLAEEQDASTYGKLNKWAGKAILANVYLNAEVYTGTPRWEECITQCNDIITENKCDLSPDYKDSFRASGVEGSKEVMFTIVYDYSRGITGNYLFMNSWHSELQKKYLLNAAPNMAGGPKGITQFINTYQAGDTRLEDSWLMGQQFDAEGNPLYGVYDMAGEPLVFTKELPDGNFTSEMAGYRMNKYEVAAGSEWSCDTDIPLIRYSEVLLMKAECLLRTGKPGAGALVTQVRQRNFKSIPDKATVTDEQLKENSAYQWGYVEDYNVAEPGDQTPVQFGRMFDELCWEFAWEGHTRRDMIRFGLFTKKSWLSHKPMGDYRKVFPIPESTLIANPELTQNPDYVK